MNELVEDIKIEDMIYEIRNKKVMLDSDLAVLFNYETKYLNRIVKRNVDKFDNNCYFKLTEEEYNSLRCQNVTLNENKRGQHKKYLPYVFTEEGVEILLTIIKSSKETSNEIINNFREKNSSLLLIKNNESTEDIRNLIYEVREKQVMVDYDLARLYKCTNGTKEINQAVKNNIEKFPERFSWKLTDEESSIFLVKNFDQKIEMRGGKYKNPRVFTEQGVAMLATIIKSSTATEVSIAIMDAFVAMRHYISNNLLEQKYINDLVIKDTKRIDLLEETFSKFKENNNEIYYEGQIYDAYSKLVDIMSKAKKELIIIDGYADKSVLDMITKIKVKVILICKTNSLLKQIDIDKYNNQYSNLKIIYNDNYHDRYIVLDRKILYHCGASLNHAGAKTFSVNKIEDSVLIDSFLTRIIEILK